MVERREQGAWGFYHWGSCLHACRQPLAFMQARFAHTYMYIEHKLGNIYVWTGPFER